MSKMLITGGAGFIGYFLAKRLSEDKNNEVVIVDNFSRGKSDSDFKELLKRQNVSFIEGDLTDKAFFRRLGRDYEFIYHLAALIGVKNVENNPDRVLCVNALATLNVFEYAKDIKRTLKRIFFASTSEVYAGTMKHFDMEIPTSEDVPLAIEDIRTNRTTYALSKLYGESAAFAYGRRYVTPVTIGRFHNVYGPRMGFAHVIPEMFVKIRKNRVVDVPSADHTRSFCFIDDAVEFAVRVSDDERAINGIFHIGNSEEEISIRNLAVKIAAIMDTHIIVKELPPTPGSTRRRCPDISKIKKLTGYTPRVALGEGMRRTYMWYKSRLNEDNEKDRT